MNPTLSRWGVARRIDVVGVIIFLYTIVIENAFVRQDCCENSLELKKRMERYPGVNWGEVVRKAIEERLRELEIRSAVETMDEIASKARSETPLTEVIRRFRDERRRRPGSRCNRRY